ncbi:MAG: J domain-containing protein [Verrucomicrobiales bacterium]
MVDYFALLGMPRQPGLDQEKLKQSFLEISSRQHPDKAASGEDAVEVNSKFTEINEAFHSLKNPKSRLLHLLDLEGFKEKERFQSINPEIANLFSEAGKLTQQADKLAKERRDASSPMMKASIFGRGVELPDQLQQFQKILQQKVAFMEEQLAPMNQFWDDGNALQGARNIELPLADLYQKAVELGFLQRLQQQVEEKISALAF